MENTLKKYSRKFVAGLMGMAFVFSALLIYVPSASAGPCVHLVLVDDETTSKQIVGEIDLVEDPSWYGYINGHNSENNGFTLRVKPCGWPLYFLDANYK